ncbi:MAG TPA: hypothetical protein ENO05_05215 [Bacteroides sp.]|nr:hypothetical protein [Bacteroides sp.]
MKCTPALILVFLIALLCNGCNKNEPDPEQQPEDVDDISTAAEVTPYGGTLQVTDESGNIILLTFPPAAVRDTTNVTLTIQGTHRDLPIDDRQIRSFDIQPHDLSLYEPAVITVQYHSAVSDIEQAAIFRLRSDEMLVPASDHAYSNGNTITANTLILGEFAEGKMTVEQINDQLELLESSLGFSLKSTGASGTDFNSPASSGCEEYKAAWDDWTETIGGFFQLFRGRMLLGYYDDLPPGSRTFEEDMDLLCSNIAEQAVKAVLDMGEPDDPCCSDYAHAVESMMRLMLGCGSLSPTFDRLNERYDRVHDQCHTYLDFTNEVNIESQNLLIMTSGEIFLTLEDAGNGEATVIGNGELTVAGSGNAGGVCSSTISGQNFVSVTGTRDAAYVYSLTLNLNQVAMMVTVCDGTVVQTALVGSDSKDLTLGPGNGFHLLETEDLDEGTATTQATINNPHTPVSETQ